MNVVTTLNELASSIEKTIRLQTKQSLNIYISTMFSLIRLHFVCFHVCFPNRKERKTNRQLGKSKSFKEGELDSLTEVSGQVVFGPKPVFVFTCFRGIRAFGPNRKRPHVNALLECSPRISPHGG